MPISDVTPRVCRRFPYGCRTVVGTSVALSRWAVVHAQCVGVPNVPTGGVPRWTVSLVRARLVSLLPQLYRSRSLLRAPLLPRLIVSFRTARTCAVWSRLSFLRARSHFLLGVATRRARAACPAWHDPIVVLGVSRSYCCFARIDYGRNRGEACRDAYRRPRREGELRGPGPGPPVARHAPAPSCFLRHPAFPGRPPAAWAPRSHVFGTTLDLVQEGLGVPDHVVAHVFGGLLRAGGRRTHRVETSWWPPCPVHGESDAANFGGFLRPLLWLSPSLSERRLWTKSSMSEATLRLQGSRRDGRPGARSRAGQGARARKGQQSRKHSHRATIGWRLAANQQRRCERLAATSQLSLW